MYSVKIKKIAPIQVIAKKAIVPNFEESGELNMAMFRELRQHVLDNNAGMPAYDIARYHGIPGQTDLILETAIPINGDLPDADELEQYSLPQETVASVIHYGTFDNYPLAHGAVQQWMQENGYVPDGSPRDVYLVFDITGNPEEWVTELQYPVKKIV